MWTMTPKVRLARKNNTRSSFDRAGEFFTENNWRQQPPTLSQNSATEAEFSNDRAVPLNVNCADVVEHTTTATNEHQQTTTGVVIFRMGLQVICQVLNS
jgi:hypothetical protein